MLVLTGVFATLALVLASLGLYGVISYSVRQRTREIGVRVAFGAGNRDVLRLVIAQGIVLALSGIVLGLGASFAVTRVMRSLLVGVSATDPVTFVAIPAVLLGVAALAAYVPARRATGIDPVEALRDE
jgi:putative ABC transport system permease protein